MRSNSDIGPIAVSHNGNLVNANTLRANLEASGEVFEATTDSEVLTRLIALSPGETIVEKVKAAMPLMEGAYSLAVMTRDRLLAVRDPLGVRPLCLGKFGEHWVVSSESCALATIGAQYVREVEPGEIVEVNGATITSHRALPARPAMCLLEFIYFARPDSTVFGESVDRVRRELGRQLAIEQPAPGADVVISVPDSSNAMALGYAEQSGLKLEHGLIRNHYVGRTFINPSQALRVAKVRIKFNPVRDVLAGRSVVVVDDSLVRGTTSKGLVQMIRAAGAREVHFRLASHPITGPCYYGIDTPTREELIAATHSIDEIRDFLGVDSLGYLSLAGMHRAAGSRNAFCDACFSGKYPVPMGNGGNGGGHG